MSPSGPLVFWNLERLFASAGSPIRAALAGGAPRRLSPAEVAIKVATIGAVLRAIGQAHGRPALVGLAEIQTRQLVQQVADASGLGLVSVEPAGRDDSGLDLDEINISLLYDPDRFDPPVQVRSHVIDRTFDTRDVLEVHLPERGTGATVFVFVNHWPSRLSLESADRRVGAAYYLSRLVSGVLRFTATEMWDPDAHRLRVPRQQALEARARAPVVVLGDFNDEPFDRPFDVLNATPELAEVQEGLSVTGRSAVERYTRYAAAVPRLWNPAWALCTGDGGTYYRSPRWRTYDQILLSRGALERWGSCRALAFQAGSVTVDGKAVSTQTASGKPRGFNEETGQGASDHFPIVVAEPV